ncbi:hypothetical protein LCGC14_2475830, partial [marine sediment metagenome]
FICTLPNADDVLNINDLTEDQLHSLSEIYDRYMDVDLGRIPQQFNKKTDTYRLRRELDKSFLEVMQIEAEDKDKELDSLYKEIDSSLTQWIG